MLALHWKSGRLSSPTVGRSHSRRGKKSSASLWLPMHQRQRCSWDSSENSCHQRWSESLCRTRSLSWSDNCCRCWSVSGLVQQVWTSFVPCQWPGKSLQESSHFWIESPNADITSLPDSLHWSRKWGDRKSESGNLESLEKPPLWIPPLSKVMGWDDTFSANCFESRLSSKPWKTGTDHCIHRTSSSEPAVCDLKKNHEKFIETRKTAEEIRALTVSLQDALSEMRRKFTSTASRLRTQKRRRFEKHQLPNFEIGDFVLLAAPPNKFHPKLRAEMDWLL